MSYDVTKATRATVETALTVQPVTRAEIEQIRSETHAMIRTLEAVLISLDVTEAEMGMDLTGDIDDAFPLDAYAAAAASGVLDVDSDPEAERERLEDAMAAAEDRTIAAWETER